MCRSMLGVQSQRDRAWPGPGGWDFWRAQVLGGLPGLYLGWAMQAPMLTYLPERESRRGRLVYPVEVRIPAYSV